MRERPRLLTVAAPDRAALVRTLTDLRALPAPERDAALARQPTTGPERLAIVAAPEALEAALDTAIARLPTLDRPRFVSRAHGLTFVSGADAGRVAFLFPGQGSEYVGMLGGLRRAVPLVAGWFDALDRAAVAAGQPPLTSLLEVDDQTDPARANLALYDMERGAQLGAVADLALHAVASALGIQADVHVGHSNGEHPAVIAAGRVLADRESLCRGFVALGRSGARLPAPARPERLLTVGMVAPERLAAAVSAAGGSLALAMDNCPTQAVVGGLADEVDAFAAEIARMRGLAAPLPFRRAYHTPLFADWSGAFADYYRSLPLGPGQVPVYSCLTSAPLPEDADGCRWTMAAQWTALVRFRTTIERLHDEGVRTFVEVGPDAKLTAFVEDTLRGRPHTAVATNAPQRDDIEQLLHALGQLFVAGLAIDAGRLDGVLAAERRPMPPAVTPAAATREALAYAAGVHERLIAAGRDQLARAAGLVHAIAPAGEAPAGDGPLLGARRQSSRSGTAWRRRFTRSKDTFVDHHALGRVASCVPGGFPLPVLAFTVSLEIVAEAARAQLGGAPMEIGGARASRWLALDDGTLEVDVDASAGDPVAVTLREVGAPVPLPAFEASARRRALPVEPLAPLAGGREATTWSPRRFYDEYAFHGPAFQGLSAIDAVGASGVEARLTTRALPGVSRDTLVFDPALLDCAGQLVAFWLLEHEGLDTDFGVFPFRAGRLVVHGRVPEANVEVRAAARITRSKAVTRADIHFVDATGRPLLTLEGFEQRIVTFPAAIARRLFGGDPTALPGHEDRAFLETSWEIWARALAHVALSPAARAQWQAAAPARDAASRLLAALGAGTSPQPVPE
ncbi:MAG: polyketide synthase dehydratase domain-containing protein [Vicinamibacterales bacterium]